MITSAAAAWSWTSNSYRFLVGGLLLLSSCASIGQSGDGVEQDFHVVAPSVDLREEVTQLMGVLLPQMSTAFRTPVEGTIFVTLTPDCESERVLRAPAFSTSEGIVVRDADPSKLAGYIGHELLHTVVRYRASFWNTLPIFLEEGICSLVELGLNGVQEIVIEGYLPRAMVEHFLGLRLQDLNSLERDQHVGTYRLAMYVVVLLGFDRIEELSHRACEEGHAVIPSEWVLEAVDQAESLRHSGRSTPLPSSVDPLFGKIEALGPRSETLTMQVDCNGHDFTSDAALRRGSP